MQVTVPRVRPVFPDDVDVRSLGQGGTLSVGIDVVHIPRMAESLRDFGERFERRLFTDAELAHAHASESACTERLAARFAAKEAALKALGLAHIGLNLKDIEVVRADTGACTLRLHGRAHDLAHDSGVSQLSVSLSHDGDHASAVVAVVRCGQN